MFFIYSVALQSILGFAPLLPVTASYHSVLVRRDRKERLKTSVPHVIAVYLFCLTLVAILTATGIPAVDNLAFSPKINPIPFVEISEYPVNYMLNVMLFVPFGFLLPVLWKKFEKMRFVLLFGAFFSLSIEIFQLFNLRVTDIDDLLMNTVGAIVGYLLFLCAKRIAPKILIFSIASENHWKWEPYCCFAFAWIIMIFIQPYIPIWQMGPPLLPGGLSSVGPDSVSQMKTLLLSLLLH